MITINVRFSSVALSLQVEKASIALIQKGSTKSGSIFYKFRLHQEPGINSNHFSWRLNCSCCHTWSPIQLLFEKWLNILIKKGKNHFLQLLEWFLVTKLIHFKTLRHRKLLQILLCVDCFPKSFVILRGRGKRDNVHARHFGGFILCTHCHKFKLLFSEYKCLDHSGIYTRKNGGAHSKHPSTFQSLKDTKTLLGLCIH